jgi:hypothetical protein
MKGGLWANKFDYKNGEQRVCKQCGDTYHAMKPRWICQKCINANQKPREEAKRALRGIKENYPFNTRTNEADKRFNSIRTALSRAWKQYNKTGDKSVITQHYDKQLKEIEDNGIMTWIFDRRDEASLRENNVKTASMTRKEYPDTRGYYED